MYQKLKNRYTLEKYGSICTGLISQQAFDFFNYGFFAAGTWSIVIDDLAFFVDQYIGWKCIDPENT